MIKVDSSSLSFKSVYKYPHASYTQKQNEGFDYALNNVLRSKKYADDKGRTLEDSFNKLGIDVVAYPTNRGGITFETKTPQAPLKSLEEVNKPYPNVTQVGCTSEEQLAEIFQLKLENCKNTLASAKKDIAWIIAGIGTMALAVLTLTYAASHNPRTQEKNIEKTVLMNDTIKESAQKAIKIFK